jgi:SAM-dependent methyltransferase
MTSITVPEPDSFDQVLRETLELAERESLPACISALEDLAAKHPDRAILYAHLGYLKELQGDLPGAIMCIETFLEFEPMNLPAKARLADCHRKAGNREIANALFREIDSASVDLTLEDTPPRTAEPLTTRIRRNIGVVLSKLPARVCDRRFYSALFREIRNFPSNRATLRDYGWRRYVTYLLELFFRTDHYRFPVQSCDSCGSDDLVATFFLASQRNVHCRNCGFDFVERKPPESLDVQTDWYNQDSSIEFMETKWHDEANLEHRLRLLEEAFEGIDEAFPKPGGRAFELGCAQGHVLVHLRERGLEVKGIETAPKLVAYCRKVHGLEVDCGTLGTLEPEPESFDYVFAYHVVEHLSKPSLFFEKAYRMLKPGGFLMVEVPSPLLHPAPLTDKLDPFHGYGNLGHMNYFTPGTMPPFFEKQGFVVRTTYTYMTETLPSTGFLGQKPGH